MISFRLRITVAPERCDEATAALQSLVGPVRAQQGCLSTRMLRELDEQTALTFVAEWRERPDLERHLQTPAFRKMLAVMELGSGPPIVEIDELGQRWGFELVEEILRVQALPGNGGERASGENRHHE